MRYPLWKLIVLLVCGPPAAAGWWYIWQDIQGVQFQVDGFILLMVASVAIPAIIIAPLASATIYFIVCACHSSYRERLASIPKVPILLAAFGPFLLAVAWVAFVAVYPGRHLPGGFFTWYLTLHVFILLTWIVRAILFAAGVAGVCYAVLRAVRWFRSAPANNLP
jgi:hypothetical protein